MKIYYYSNIYEFKEYYVKYRYRKISIILLYLYIDFEEFDFGEV